MELGLDDRDVAEFLEWRKTRHTPLQEAVRQIQMTLDRPYSRGMDSVMPVVAYRTLAEAFLLLYEEMLKR